MINNIVKKGLEIMNVLLPDNVFRANAGAVIINNDGYVLAFERLKIKGAWQFPQGGLNENEEPLEAIYREVSEETNISAEKLKLISDYPEWLAYELSQEMRMPKHGRGQVQKWFLFRFNGSDSNIDVVNVQEKEFKAWKWTRIEDIIDGVPPFKRQIYLKLRNYWINYFV